MAEATKVALVVGGSRENHVAAEKAKAVVEARKQTDQLLAFDVAGHAGRTNLKGNSHKMSMWKMLGNRAK